MFWVNGESTDYVSVTDRSFQYGDGCFTTMLTCNGDIQHWAFHVDRMDACLKLLEIHSPDWNKIYADLKHVALSSEKAGLKLHISRGEGGRGYSPSSVDTPNITVSQFSFPNHYESLQRNGVALGVCCKQLGHNPMLAGHKHNNRLEQVLLKSEMDKRGFADGISLDIEDNVIETTMANLFWLSDNMIYTPSLDKAGVAGVMRRVVLDMLPSIGFEVKVGEFKLEQVLDAEELFITNSILNIAPVTKVEDRCYAIGKVTRRIQEYFKS